MTLSATELRIGNLVSNQDGTLQENPIGEPHVIDISDFEWAGMYVPIPLTEKWLLKFGFKEVNLMGFKGCWQYPFDDKYFIQQMQNTTTLFLDAEKTQHLITAFDYVHQLQNLYFALTGEELTYESVNR